jgi:hypothetical protein
LRGGSQRMGSDGDRLPRGGPSDARGDVATWRWRPACRRRAPAPTPRTHNGRPVPELLSSGRLGFDHGASWRTASSRTRAKLEYTPLGAAFCETTFTVAELRGLRDRRVVCCSTPRGTSTAR